VTTKKIFWIFIILAVVYLTLNIVIPPGSSALTRYGLTDEQITVVRLSMAIPIIIIWFLGYYGYDKFKQYANTIAGRKEGKAFDKIAQGLLMLALWLPINGITTNLSTYVASNNPGYAAAATIIKNYIVVVVVLLAFYFLYIGSSSLLKKTKRIAVPKRSLVNLIFVVLSLFFVYWTLINPVRQFPSAEYPTAVYYLPDWLLIPTIILPYLAAFYFGMLAVQNIVAYRYKAKGIIYRNSLSSLANGIGILVISVILIRYLTAFITQLGDTTLKALLLLIYCLILFIALGYISIALGAKKLQKIEEV
jgi:hypothetical protein